MLERFLVALLAPLVLFPAGCGAPRARALEPGSEPSEAERTDARQIDWQRSLEDALALVRDRHRPLFIAVNMDGESASDRIVRENYRDPHFVALTRSFVCLAASAFRHTPRDHDDAGRRIPCPRLGGCTCGEHMALEPLLYERYLSDGERVAPRHAVILPDGTKVWDLSLAFDLADIDRELAPLAHVPEALPAAAPARDWSALALRRDAAGREVLELELGARHDEADLERALEALAQLGDAGSLEALRRIAVRLPSVSPGLVARFLASAHALGLESEVAALLRERAVAPDPLAYGADPGEGARYLPWLAELDGARPAGRSFLLACRALEGYGEEAASALEHALGATTARELGAALETIGGALDLRALLTAARTVTRTSGARPGSQLDAMPGEAELERALETLEASLDREDPESLARFAKTTLDLARRRIESRGGGVQELLEDAETSFALALARRPERADWWIERARTSYFRNRFEQQAECGRRALDAATGGGGWPDEATLIAPDGTLVEMLEDPTAVEAMRWIGDADARLLETRSGGDAFAELVGLLEGLRALGLVALSPLADAKDWQSFVSLAGALGLAREECAIARAGVERLTAAPELRQSLNLALWNAGRFELAPAIADALVDQHPESADAWWFAGQAWLLAAEDLRRREEPLRAPRAYAAARTRFEHARVLFPDYAESCAWMLAQAWLGSGMAEVRAGRRTEAADALVHAAETHAGLTQARDGLGYDVLDLVDKILEWRATGPSPVDPLELCARLEPLTPGDPALTLALSDSLLREALRADGRNPERALRDTVDASGQPIRMLMGLPDAEGDEYLRAAIEVARRARASLSSEEERKVLAQADTIWAERMLERGRLDEVAPSLREAAGLMDLAAPEEGAGVEDWRALAAELRERLGEARPRWREGR